MPLSAFLVLVTKKMRKYTLSSKRVIYSSMQPTRSRLESRYSRLRVSDFRLFWWNTKHLYDCGMIHLFLSYQKYQLNSLDWWVIQITPQVAVRQACMMQENLKWTLFWKNGRGFSIEYSRIKLFLDYFEGGILTHTTPGSLRKRL